MNIDEINILLENHNLRKTSGMQKILAIFIQTKKPLTAEEVYNKIKNYVNQSTVYRIIKRFTKNNLIHEVHLSQEKKYYELTNRGHHHHLVCTSCETIVDIPCIDEIVKKIKPQNYNFNSIKSHSFELFGTCNNCK